MSRFTGKQYKGAMRDLRQRKREEAEARDKALPLDSPRRGRVVTFGDAEVTA